MSFDSILGQERALTRLREMIVRERIPSALLFLGPHGVGKRTTALALAQALNCGVRPGEGCGACPGCRKIAVLVHSDVDVISPDGQSIKIDQIRAVTDRLSLIPFEARKRVIVIHQAERLNVAAANAFLKTLEEPPQDSLIVLTASDASLLPETIVSRCMPLHFSPLPPGIVRELLSRDTGLSSEEAEFALRHSQGRLRPELRQGAGKLMLLREDVLASMERLDRLAFDEIADRAGRWSGAEEWPFILECMESWFHDVALTAAGLGAERLVFGDRYEAVARWGARVSPARAGDCLREVLSFRGGMALNVNKALAMEALLLGLRRIVSRIPRAAAESSLAHQGG